MSQRICPGVAELALAAAVAWAGPVQAADHGVDTSDWRCEYCPFEQGHRGDYAPTTGYVSDDSAIFDDATGLGEEGIFADIDGAGAFTGEQHRADWTLEDLGLASRTLRVRGTQAGTFDYQLDWQQLPRRQFFTSRSIFAEGAGDSLLLPDGWVRSGVTDGFTTLAQDLQPRSIESDRDTLALGGRWFAAERLRVTAAYRRQRQEGNDIVGGALFNNASLLPMTFDYTTDEVDLGLRYGIGNGHLALQWYLSDFSSDNAAFRWTHPFTTLPGAEQSELAQPPANQFQQLTLSGAYEFPEARTTVSLSAARGRIEQDATFLASTTNANLAAAPVPRTSLDGEVETTALALAVSSRPIPRARVALRWRYDERDNQTPQALYERVIADSFLSGDPELNLPYSYLRTTLNLSGHFDLLEPLRVRGGYERRRIDRSLQEVSEQREDRGWAGLRWQATRALQFDVSGGTARRDIDSYDEALAIALGQNLLLRKYNLAYRFRTFGEFTAQYAPTQLPLSITLTSRLADDDYSQSPLGLTSADDRRFAGDLAWTVSEKTSLHASGALDRINATQLGSESLGAADWRGRNRDRFATYGAGLRVRELGQRWDLHLDVTRADGTSRIEVDDFNVPGTSVFPELQSTWDDIRLGLVYRRSERLSVGVNLRYQHFDGEDWALQDVGPSTIREVLSLGAIPYDDDIIVLGLTFRYALVPPEPGT